MKRASLAGVVLLATAALVAGAGAGCNFIVGVGDYAVGASEGGSGDDGSSAEGSSSGSSGSSSGSDGSSSGTSSGDSGGDGSMGGPDSSDARPLGDASGSLGDPCTRNGDCARGTCNGHWCTQPCTSNSSCGDNGFGQPNYCITNATGGGKSCSPGCAANSDCMPYRGTSCTQIPGGAAFVCTVSAATDGGPGTDASTGTAIIGDPCKSDADCAVGTCIPPIPAGTTSWCGTSCASATDTSCGFNSLGQQNYCILDASNKYSCFPGCVSNADCTAFSFTTCQVTASGASTSICATTSGNVGDPCSTSANSQWGPCTSPAACSNNIWCSQSCTADSACGTNTAGQAGFCVPSSGGGSICFPGCTVYNDCATYPGTFCQQIYNSTRGFVCAASGHQIGDPCATNADCNQGTCIGNWCSQSCASATDTSCGSNSESQTNQCVLDNLSSTFVCFPGCATNADCTAYGGATCLSTGSGGTVCSF